MSNLKKTVLTVSSANMDFVMNINTVPEAGQTLLDNGTYKYVPGGKGANSATTFARLGAESVFCTCVGNDSHGDTLLSLYENEKINTSHIRRDTSAPTGLAAIFVERNGMNRIIVFPGANMKINREDIGSAFESKPDALFLQLEISREANLSAAKIAAEHNVPIFMDAGPADVNFPLALLPELEVFSPNETEAEAFTGIKPDAKDPEKLLLAAKKLASLVNAKYYVIKLGAAGAYIFDGKNGTVSHSFKTHAVDTTAAGDAFTAALVLEYLRTGDIIAAARYGNAAGAITVSRRGASTSLPNAEEVEAFLRSNPEENL